MNDLNIQSRESKLSTIIEKAEDLIENGIEDSLIVCEELDNSKEKKKDWMEPAYKRNFVVTIKKSNLTGEVISSNSLI